MLISLVTMATPSQDLHINHTYAKESEAVGEEMGGGGLLVIGSLYNVADRHNQSPPQLHQKREKKVTHYWRLYCLISVL